MKTGELSGALLDYWVAKCQGAGGSVGPRIAEFTDGERYCVLPGPQIGERASMPDVKYLPSKHWSVGGPIIERCLISILYAPVDSMTEPGSWVAFIRPSDDLGFNGPTPLVAAMRAYVASQYGDEVPDEVTS